MIAAPPANMQLYHLRIEIVVTKIKLLSLYKSIVDLAKCADQDVVCQVN